MHSRKGTGIRQTPDQSAPAARPMMNCDSRNGLLTSTPPPASERSHPKAAGATPPRRPRADRSKPRAAARALPARASPQAAAATPRPCGYSSRTPPGSRPTAIMELLRPSLRSQSSERPSATPAALGVAITSPAFHRRQVWVGQRRRHCAWRARTSAPAPVPRGLGGRAAASRGVAKRLAQLVGGVACDRVEPERQERREDGGVVDGAGRDAEPGGSEVCDHRAGEAEVLDAHAVQADVSSPGGECVYAVVSDDHQPRPEPELGGELACTGPEAEDLGPLPGGVV